MHSQSSVGTIGRRRIHHLGPRKWPRLGSALSRFSEGALGPWRRPDGASLGRSGNCRIGDPADFHPGRCAGWKMKTYRVFCAVFGLLALFGLFLPLLQIMPPISAEGDVLPRPGIATVLTRDSWFAL